MGEVFLATDTRLHRSVAIKLLRGAGVLDSAGRQRFQVEARAASALNHPHICTVYDVGEQDGHPYLVMELLEGETLRDRIARGPLPIDEVVRLAKQIADALDAAHQSGHRPPRHQAREHLRHAPRSGEDPGLRHREACRRARSDDGVRWSDDQRRHDARHDRVYVARTGAR